MEFLGIDELMRYLKRQYDSSNQRHEWRALTGRDHVKGVYDTFLFSEEKIYQIKAAEVARGRMVAVGGEIGSNSPDLADMSKDGSPIPIGMVSRAADASSVILFGMQQYSSETADTLKLEYFESKQERLERDLKTQLDKALERPEFRATFRSLREDQESYFS
jgi:hypothetical protein